MTDTERSRVNVKLDEILDRLKTIETIMRDYDDLRSCVKKSEMKIQAIEQNCLHIQSTKTKVNWGTVVGTIIACLTVAVITSVATVFINTII